MDFFSEKYIKNLLKKYQILPKKRFGQNFLINKKVLKQIIEAASLKEKDIILEIGPGIGNLTQELAKRVKKVIAVEKDKIMVEVLRETVKYFKNIRIIQGDILKLNAKYKIPNTKYKVVANLPYYITSPVIRMFLGAKNPPGEMVLMVQKEVAQRIVAQPPNMTRSTSSGSSRAGRGMNLLAISVQFYAKPEIISFVSKKSFWPSPKVDSAIIKITPQINTNKERINTDLFFKVVKAGFSQPRKQLINNLSRLNFSSKNLGAKDKKIKVEKWLLKNGVQPSQRAETLSISDWLRLTQTFSLA